MFWHRALYGAYVSIMNALFWIPKEEQAVPPEAVDKVRRTRMHSSVVGRWVTHGGGKKGDPVSVW